MTKQQRELYYLAKAVQVEELDFCELSVEEAAYFLPFLNYQAM